ncbi:uncharacterized protein N7500_001724 [Penicillium coprophilum]|uniref:uncharacterized protein n=1 Tax=Penicillium coprophilum TaxID=36646 RepID=UPI00238E90ED|nr:uncharacterized protein N7500_001724 [Penicillium coprophilum]KAJ5173793.1 hypothetical protein N7500_001724 [Penicillium coprophilum]
MPVTRSQSKNLAYQNPSSAQGNTKDGEISIKSLEQEQTVRGASIEWLDWNSREAEDIYKTTVTRGSEDSGEWKLASDSFVEELNALRMLGYEAWHAKFEEIKILV